MGTLAVKLPDVGEGVTQAELVEWCVKVGDVILEDSPLAAVMTDKATVEIPSLYSGTVVWLAGEIGDVLAVGADLVRIETDKDAAVSPEGKATVHGTGEDPAPDGEIAVPSTESQASPARLPQPDSPPPKKAIERTSVTQQGAPRAEGSEPLASPSVRARARTGGVDLRQVRGSGPAGRITHDDIDGVFAATGSPTAGLGLDPGRRRLGSSEIKVVGMRRKIAERMTLANSRIPHITIVEEVDVTALEDLRERLNADREDRPKLTVLPFITAALAQAFLDHPEVNAHFDDDACIVTRFGPVHLGIATMTKAGLVVPVLRHAEALGLFETAAEIARLSATARDGKAAHDELTGSTFTISSLGPLGAIATTPIINHPEVAILGVNKMAVRPMWDGSEFRPRKMMNFSASFDHRVIDGWDAAMFVQRIKSLVETPALIFMGQAQ